MNHPFEEFFERRIAPTIKLPPGIPKNVASEARAAVRATMAECWNTAVDESARWFAAPEEKTERTELLRGYMKVKNS